MKHNGPRYSKEEIARRGDAIYVSKIRPTLGIGNKGQFVAVDIETGEFELDVDEMAACKRLRARVPSAQTWLVRIGSRYVHRFGGAETSEIPQ